MTIDKEIKKLISDGYYIDFEMDSDNEFMCYIKDGYYEEDITKSVYGTGKTLTESFFNAKDKL